MRRNGICSAAKSTRSYGPGRGCRCALDRRGALAWPLSVRQPDAVHHRNDRCGGIPGDRAESRRRDLLVQSRSARRGELGARAGRGSERRPLRRPRAERARRARCARRRGRSRPSRRPFSRCACRSLARRLYRPSDGSGATDVEAFGREGDHGVRAVHDVPLSRAPCCTISTPPGCIRWARSIRSSHSRSPGLAARTPARRRRNITSKSQAPTTSHGPTVPGHATMRSSTTQWHSSTAT